MYVHVYTRIYMIYFFERSVKKERNRLVVVVKSLGVVSAVMSDFFFIYNKTKLIHKFVMKKKKGMPSVIFK